MDSIVLRNVRKSYDGKVFAVENLNLTVPVGGVFGFLGPNGAGKTTTVKMLSGLLTPNGGELSVGGFDSVRQPEKVHEISALMTESTMMYDHLTAMENLTFFGKLFGMPEELIRRRGAELIERVGLSDAKGKLKTFSTGMRQRLSLARVLLHQPKVLFLDEPTSGLDPESVKWVNQIIAEQGKSGATVFLCTHQLRYAQEICTQYGLMDRGRLLASGTFEELMAQTSAKHRVQVRSSDMPHALMRRVSDGMYEREVEDDAEIAALIGEIVRAGASVYEVRKVTDSLEDLYFALLKRREGGAA